MKEQKFLEQYITLTGEIESLTEQIEYMEAQQQRTVKLYDKIQVSGTLDLRRMEHVIYKEQEYIDALNYKKLERLIVLQEIFSAIYALPNATHRKVLESRYIFNMKWNDVAKKMGLSRGYVLQAHREAIICIVVPSDYQEEILKKAVNLT